MTHACPRLRRAVVTATAVGVLVVPLAGGTASAGPAARPGAVTATAPAGMSPTGVRRLSPDVVRQLDQAVLRVMRQAGVPGVTVGLWTPDEGEYVKSFGVADRSTGRKMSPDLYMRIGSETKTFTVTALLHLVDRHKVRLDDPVGKYVAGVPNGNGITLRQLAGMRSGLFDYTADAGFRKELTSDPHRAVTPHQLLAYAFKHLPLFPPGRRFEYSNTNVILLGLVVEKAGGRPLADYTATHVLRPTGLDQTFFPAGAQFPRPHAQGYTNQTPNGEVRDAAHWNPSWAWAAGAMISNLDDLRVWARTVATGVLPDGTRLISTASQKQRLTTHPTSVPGAGYGLGIFDVRGWIGHNGSLPGYESLTVHLTPARTTLVVLLNSDIDEHGTEPSTLLGRAITKIVTPGHVFDLPARAAVR
ncbi:serine hydrolase domain-containing protein [Streptomyces sp. NPDC088770]|uniref:serine hydrolase domain-containing protein n=1 Tax=Streptomyces sp. NPDC088770 TaxID=3365895 RepID=UPI0037F96F4E